jgi:hypothetical protein
MYIDRGNRSSRRKPAPAPLLSITKSHMTRTGFEPGPSRWEAGAMARPTEGIDETRAKLGRGRSSVEVEGSKPEDWRLSPLTRVESMASFKTF